MSRSLRRAIPGANRISSTWRLSRFSMPPGSIRTRNPRSGGDNPRCDVVVVNFPGVTGIKRRPAVVLSSDTYHSTRPDMIVGLVTSHAVATLGPTDYALED